MVFFVIFAYAVPVFAASEKWVCENCGTESSGNFCPQCGEKKPGWECAECGAVSSGNTCENCGAIRPWYLGEVNKGEYITFGRYEQDNDASNGAEIIEWIVLDVKDDKALVISRYGLENKRYHDSLADITWESCDLRAWLNSTFLNEAFSVTEQSILEEVSVTAEDNPVFGTEAGEDTKDRLFIMSANEAEQLLPESDRACEATSYAGSLGAYVDSNNGKSVWWLRSPGRYSTSAARVGFDGSVNYGGYSVDIDYTCVRPAAWINLIKAKSLTQNDTSASIDTEENKDDSESEDETEYLNEIVGNTAFDLIAYDPGTGERLIRNGETNLSDFLADVYRYYFGADIGLVIGGSIRSEFHAGDITYSDVLDIYPWNFFVEVVEIPGQVILDCLEMGARLYPDECGGWVHPSGLTYTVDSTFLSNVLVNEDGDFVSVDGEYRVKNVMVGGEPLDLERIYTVAVESYISTDCGDGMSMFKGCKVIVPTDEEYYIDHLVVMDYLAAIGGVIPEEYADMEGQGRITIIH